MFGYVDFVILWIIMWGTPAERSVMYVVFPNISQQINDGVELAVIVFQAFRRFPQTPNYALDSDLMGSTSKNRKVSAPQAISFYFFPWFCFCQLSSFMTIQLTSNFPLISKKKKQHHNEGEANSGMGQLLHIISPMAFQLLDGPQDIKSSCAMSSH